MAQRPVERVYTASWSDVRTAVEVRSGPNGESSRRIGGYAAVFGKSSQPLGGFREIVERSFFNKSQSDGWPLVVCRFEHNPLMLLGSSASGTLQLFPDNIGLDYTVDVPECRSDTMELANRGDLLGSSFSFQVFQDDWKPTGGGYPVRHLVSGRLIDVAPTAIPAYPDSTVGVRSYALGAWQSLSAFADASLEDIERMAAQDDLRKLFIRTDMRSAPTGEHATTVQPEEEPKVADPIVEVQQVEEPKVPEVEPKSDEQPKEPEKVEEPKAPEVEPKSDEQPKEPEVERLPAPADLFAEISTNGGKSIREAKLELMEAEWVAESESV